MRYSNNLVRILVLGFVFCSLGLYKAHAARIPRRPDSSPVKLYVAPSGDDRGPGTLSQPLASLSGARDQIRGVFDKSRGVVVYLREGFYAITETFQLKQQDSGTAEAPIVYQAYPGETAILHGARRLDALDFAPVMETTVLNRLSPSVQAQVYVIDLAAQGITDYGQLSQFTDNQIAEAELFIDERPMTLAQWPNEGFTRIGKVLDKGSIDPPRGAQFGYTDPRPETWATLEDVWAVGFWRVEMLDSVRVAELDSSRKLIRTKTAPRTWNSTGITSNHRLYFVNVLEELDAPTEYYIDRIRGKLYVYPPRPFQADTKIQLSMMRSKLIDLDRVSHVTFQNLVFEASRADALGSSHASHIEISGCTFRNLGRRAIVMWLGHHNTISDCNFWELGAGGIRIFGGDRQTLERGEYRIENNHLYNYGRRDRTTCWPIRTERVGHTVSHNLVHGSWRGGCSFPGNDHLFEYNEICHIIKTSNDTSSIGAGFNWTGSGTDIRYNFIHHYHGEPSHSIIAVGVYVDDGLSGNRVTHNVFYDLDMGFFSHGGRGTTVNNNLFIDCDRSFFFMDPSLVNWWGSRFETLIRRLDEVPSDQPLYTDKYPHLFTIFDDLAKNASNPNNKEYQYPKDNVGTRNLIYNSGAPEIPANAAAYGQFLANVPMAAGADAGFIDSNSFNFGLRADAPVYDKIPGFEPIPFAEIGLQVTEQRPDMPRLGEFDLLLPSQGQIFSQGGEVEFMWESCRFADVYELEIAEDEDFNRIVRRETVEDMCRAYSAVSVGDLALNQTYYWRVRAFTHARSMHLASRYARQSYSSFTLGRVLERSTRKLIRN